MFLPGPAPAFIPRAWLACNATTTSLPEHCCQGQVAAWCCRRQAAQRLLLNVAPLPPNCRCCVGPQQHQERSAALLWPHMLPDTAAACNLCRHRSRPSTFVVQATARHVPLGGATLTLFALLPDWLHPLLYELHCRAGNSHMCRSTSASSGIGTEAAACLPPPSRQLPASCARAPLGPLRCCWRRAAKPRSRTWASPRSCPPRAPASPKPVRALRLPASHCPGARGSLAVVRGLPCNTPALPNLALCSFSQARLAAWPGPRPSSCWASAAPILPTSGAWGSSYGRLPPARRRGAGTIARCAPRRRRQRVGAAASGAAAGAWRARRACRRRARPRLIPSPPSFPRTPPPQ